MHLGKYAITTLLMISSPAPNTYKTRVTEVFVKKVYKDLLVPWIIKIINHLLWEFPIEGLRFRDYSIS